MGGRAARRAAATTGVGLVLAALSAGRAKAAVPQILTEQGQLLDASGNPVAGNIQLTFALYAAATGGTPSSGAQWHETQTITLDDGFFSAILGESTPLPASIFTGVPLFLGVTVGTDPEMTPREAVFSVPYALVAGNANGDIMSRL